MVGNPRFYVPAAIIGAAGVASLLPLSSAIGQESPPTSIINVEVADSGTIDARGAVAYVTVFYTCTSGADFASVSVRLTQRSGNGIASGSGGEEEQQLVCDGTSHSVNVTVTPQQKPFKKGEAVAQVFGSVCGGVPFGCSSDSDTEIIALERA